MDAWRTVDKKTEFIHKALNPEMLIINSDKFVTTNKKVEFPNIIKTPEDAEKATKWQGSNFKKGKK